MNIREKLSLIVISSILLTAIPASLLIFHYSKQQILKREATNLISITDNQVELISQRLSQSKPKLESLSHILERALQKPIKKGELEQFYQLIELDPDGVWRNQRNTYNGKEESGIFLPDTPQLSDEQKIAHIRIKHVMDDFGAAANNLNENVWYLSLHRSEIIFDRSFPDFAFDQHADNDYTQTPWVTYTSPELNPNREFKFTPPLFDPVPKVWMVSALYPLYLNNKWIGSLGEDLQLSSVLGFLLKSQQLYPGTEHFIIDGQGNFILAGHWQAALESESEPSKLDFNAKPGLKALLSNPLNENATLLSESLLIDGKKYIAIGKTITPANWRYFKLVPIDDIVKPVKSLLFTLILAVFFVSLVCGGLINIAINNNVISRIKRLVESMRLYELGQKQHLSPLLQGTDEISIAAKEFDLMIDRVEKNSLEIKHTNKALVESEQRWKFALEGAGDGVWDWNIKTGKALFSQQWKQMLGYSDEEFANLASEWQAHLHPEDRPIVQQRLNDYFTNKRPDYTTEFRMRCKDGSWKWILARGMVVERDTEQNPIRMLGTHTDISHQKNIESELRNNAAQLEFMLENSPVAVRITSEQGRRVLFSNKRYAELINQDPQYVNNLDPSPYYLNQSEYEEILSSIDEGLSISNRLLQLKIPDQSNKWVLASYLPIQYQGETCLLGWFYDVSDQLKAEETVRLHASVFNNAWEGIVITDVDNKIISVNEAFTEITGYSPEDVIHQDPKILSSGREQKTIYQEMWQALKESGHWRGEVWNRKKDGEIYAEILTVGVVKDKIGVVTHYVGIFADITEMKNTENLLKKLAHYDPLTQLPNRTLLSDRLNQAIAQAARNKTTLAVCFLDLDGFKAVNDSLGHETGDKLLAKVANRLTSVIRSGDTVARMGGDEFVILLANITDLDELDPALTRINEIIAQEIIINNQSITISSSMGITLYPADNVSSDILIRHADLAMYEAKQAGKNTYHLFDAGLDQEVHLQHQKIERIKHALNHDELRLFYQPKVNLQTGDVIGMEALIRWQHPEKGLLGPFEFLPDIENHDLIVELGDWVIMQALEQMKLWHELELDLHVSVNVTARQIQHADFIDKLKLSLALYPEVSPNLLELEILETSAIETLQIAEVIRSTFAQLGVSFALDDFGTGYSSLTYLKHLPVKTLKIDQSFVRDMLIDMEDQAIVKGIIELARAFKIDVIAEGVETNNHATKLVALGCQLAQGYAISRPMPADEVVDWVKAYDGQ